MSLLEPCCTYKLLVSAHSSAPQTACSRPEEGTGWVLFGAPTAATWEG